MGEWLPISTAPKDGTLIDLWVQFRDRAERRPDFEWMDRGWRNIRDAADVVWEDGQFPYATHWMPRPPPPVSP